MSLIKVGARYQVTIPKQIAERLSIHAGDYFEVTQEEGKIVLSPKRILNREDGWFWSKEWQEKESEADLALSQGDHKDFEDVEQLIRELNA